MVKKILIGLGLFGLAIYFFTNPTDAGNNVQGAYNDVKDFFVALFN